MGCPRLPLAACSLVVVSHLGIHPPSAECPGRGGMGTASSGASRSRFEYYFFTLDQYEAAMC